MRISISYQATRSAPVNAEETARINQAIQLMSVDAMIDGYLAGDQPDGAGKGLNWESFISYYPATLAAQVVFVGSTKLPDNTEDADSPRAER